MRSRPPSSCATRPSWCVHDEIWRRLLLDCVRQHAGYCLGHAAKLDTRLTLVVCERNRAPVRRFVPKVSLVLTERRTQYACASSQPTHTHTRERTPTHPSCFRPLSFCPSLPPPKQGRRWEEIGADPMIKQGRQKQAASSKVRSGTAAPPSPLLLSSPSFSHPLCPPKPRKSRKKCTPCLPPFDMHTHRPHVLRLRFPVPHHTSRRVVTNSTSPPHSQFECFY